MQLSSSHWNWLLSHETGSTNVLFEGWRKQIFDQVRNGFRRCTFCERQERSYGILASITLRHDRAWLVNSLLGSHFGRFVDGIETRLRWRENMASPMWCRPLPKCNKANKLNLICRLPPLVLIAMKCTRIQYWGSLQWRRICPFVREYDGERQLFPTVISIAILCGLAAIRGYVTDWHLVLRHLDKVMELCCDTVVVTSKLTS